MLCCGGADRVLTRFPTLERTLGRTPTSTLTLAPSLTLALYPRADRLAIAKRGGGTHYTDEERAAAATAYKRLGVLYEYTSMASQLADKAEQCRRLGGVLAAQRCLKEEKILERFAQLQKQVSYTFACSVVWSGSKAVVR